jgi:hypothetical protein
VKRLTCIFHFGPASLFAFDSLCAIVSIFFASLALVFGVYGVFTCNAAEFPQENGDGAITVGLFGYRTKSYTYVQDGDGGTVWVSNYCLNYDALNGYGDFEYTTDKMTDALQGLAISLAVIGSVFTIMSCIVPCLPKFNPVAWKGLGLMFLLCCILQGCSLLLLQSSICLDNPVIQYLTAAENTGVLATLQDPAKCGQAPGFKMSISAVVFWFVAGIIPLIVPAPGNEAEITGADPVPDVEGKEVLEAVEEAK